MAIDNREKGNAMSVIKAKDETEYEVVHLVDQDDIETARQWFRVELINPDSVQALIANQYYVLKHPRGGLRFVHPADFAQDYDTVEESDEFERLTAGLELSDDD